MAGRVQGLRSRLLLAVVVAVAAALAGLIGAFNVVLDQRLDSDASALARARNSAALATLSTANGRLSLPEAHDARGFDSPTWIYADRRALEQPAVGPVLASVAASLAAGPRRVIDVADPHTRLVAVPVLDHGHRVGTVISGASLAAYDRTRRIALLASLALGGVLLAGVFLAARWALAAALRPVARMTASAAQWSEHDIDRRFGLGPGRDELTQLAGTLDGLLDRLSAGLRREQRFSAELSHELRTPLARISAEAQLALRIPRDEAAYRQALTAILAATDQMERALEALIAAARVEIGGRQGTADAAAAADAVAAAWASAAGERGVAVEVNRPPKPLRVAVEADLAERILHPLVENACRYARTRVSVAVGRTDGGVRYTVTDDGPGVAGAERDRIFEPGVRGSAAHDAPGSSRGAGLGLALARRLTAAGGGRLSAEPDPAGGHFTVELPAA